MGRRRRRSALLGVAAAALTMAACTSRSDSDPPPTQPPGTAASTSTTLLDVAAFGRDVLVEVRSEGRFAEGAGPTTPGQGTGVLVSDDGLILTAASAVVGADRINVFAGGDEFPREARLEAAAQCPNLALVKIDGVYEPAEFGDADAPTAGLVSVVDGTTRLEDATEVLDTRDAGLGVWNIGGITISPDGLITGVATRGAGNRPIVADADTVQQWLTMMRSRDITDQLGFGIIDGAAGPVVTGLSAAGEAAAAGLEVGDVIVAFGGAPVVDAVDVCRDGVDKRPLDIEVLRDGRRYVGAIGGAPMAVASARTQEQLREAVVRVDANYPGLGSGTGSGFFISEDGLAVTNYHVVAGSDNVELVFDGGERRVPAAIVGRSMCHDLAVLQAEGDGYTFLEWAPGPPALEEPVRTIGFPAGTDSLTIQQGAVAKERADPPSFSPLVALFEHSAEVNRGNSGGPVVNEIGEVLGVTNAVTFRGITTQELAIVGVEAVELVERLLGGDLFHPGFWADLELNESLRYAGLLNLVVDRVDPGGPADLAGIERSDRIFDLGGTRDIENGLDFGSVCGALQAAGNGEVAVVAGRDSGDRLLTGNLGSRLTESSSEQLVFDPSFALASFVPGDWQDYETIEPDTANDWLGFRAAPDTGAFLSDFGRRPGARLLYSAQLAEEETTTEYLDRTSYGQCDAGTVDPVSVGAWDGHRRIWSDCLGEPFEIRSNAFDTGDGIRVLILVAARSVEIDWVDDLVLGTTSLAPG